MYNNNVEEFSTSNCKYSEDAEVNLLYLNQKLCFDISNLVKILRRQHDKMCSKKKFNLTPFVVPEQTYIKMDYNGMYDHTKFWWWFGILKNLASFALNESIQEEMFMNHLQNFVEHFCPILVIKEGNIQQIKTHLKHGIEKFVDYKNEQENYEYIFFILKKANFYHLLVYNMVDNCFYFYEGSPLENIKVIEELIFYFKVDQLIHIKYNETKQVDSLFHITDLIFKIIFTSLDASLENIRLSLAQLINLPSQSDPLKVIIIYQFIIDEIDKIEILMFNAKIVSE